MNTNWVEPEHVGKTLVSIFDVLAKEFHAESKKKEPNFDKMFRLSQATGYQAQIYGTMLKAHEFERRLHSVEKTLSKVTPEEVAMLSSPILVAEETNALR